MANKYSRYQLKPYVSQYVDPQRVAISGLLRQRYEKGLEGHTNLVSAAGSMKVGAKDQQIKDDVLADIQNDFKDITKNNNYEDSGRVLATAQNKYLGNEGLQTAVQSYKNWEKEQETASQIKMTTGRDVLFDKVYATDENGNVMYDENKNPIIVNKFDEHQSYYQDEETGRMVKNVYQGTGQMQLQYSDQMQKIIENIAGDPVALRKLAKAAGFENPDDLIGYLVYGQEVEDEKVVKLMKALSDTYINASAEGKQQMLKLTTAVGSSNIDPSTGNHWTAEQAEAIIQDQMLSIARQQVGSDLQYLTDQAYIARMKSQEEYVNPKLQTFNSDATQNSQVVTGLDFISEDKDFDENGSLITTMTQSGLTKVVTLGSKDANAARTTYHVNRYNALRETGLSRKDASRQRTKEMSEMELNWRISKAIDLGIIDSSDDPGLRDSQYGKDLNSKQWKEFAAALKEETGEKNWSTTMYSELYGTLEEEDSEQAEALVDRQRERLMREINTAKKEGRSPRLSIVGANKYLYMELMRDLYPEVSENSKTDKEFFKNMAHMQEQYEVASTKVYKPTNEYTAGFRETILSSPTNWILRREDGTFTNNMTDVQILLGYKTKKGNWKTGDSRTLWENMITKEQLSPILGLMTGGQQSGSFAIKLTGEDGKDYTVELGNSNEAQQQFRAPHEIINDLQSGRANDYRTAETAKIIQTGQTMLDDGAIVDVEMKVHYEINTNTMEWEPVVTQYYYTAGTRDEYKQSETMRRQGTGVIDILMEQAVSSYMGIYHMVGTDMNVGKKTDLSNPTS